MVFPRALADLVPITALQGTEHKDKGEHRGNKGYSNGGGNKWKQIKLGEW